MFLLVREMKYGYTFSHLYQSFEMSVQCFTPTLGRWIGIHCVKCD